MSREDLFLLFFSKEKLLTLRDVKNFFANKDQSKCWMYILEFFFRIEQIRCPWPSGPLRQEQKWKYKSEEQPNAQMVTVEYFKEGIFNMIYANPCHYFNKHLEWKWMNEIAYIFIYAILTWHQKWKRKRQNVPCP